MIAKLYWLLALTTPPADGTISAGTTMPKAVPQGRGGGAIWQLLMPLIIVFVIMYLFVVAPQRKREKQRRAMLDAISKGDEVVTIGGIYGRVWQLKEKEVVLKVGDDVKMTFSRGAIARVVKEDMETKK